MNETCDYIESITLDEASIAPRTPELDHERSVAVHDLTEWNHFAVIGKKGPYAVTLGSSENRITLSIRTSAAAKPFVLAIPLAPFRSVIRDYGLICESYFEAVKTGNIARIEAIDMSRRGLHNEGSALLTGLLEGKVEMDTQTARRLFTLLHVLHLK
jgi:uncharacterized protein (UPF0262 family)